MKEATKSTLILILLFVIVAMWVSDRFIKCRATREGHELMEDVLDELTFTNDYLEKLN
jgi:flagellar biogenesis protein FliO